MSSHVGDGLAYTFSTQSYSLFSPFSPPVAFGTTYKLVSVTHSGLSLTHAFETSSAGEVTKVTLPYGAYFQWAYRDFTYTGSRTFREVQYRYLLKQTGASPTTYTFMRKPNPAGGGHYGLEPAPERSQQTTWFGRRAELPSASMKERRRETRAIHFPLNDCHSPQ